MSRTVETAKTARLNKLKRDAVDVGKIEVSLKHAGGENDEDVVLRGGWGQQCKARLETLKQDIVDANAKEEGDDEAVEMLRDTIKKSREKYCKMVEKEMG